MYYTIASFNKAPLDTEKFKYYKKVQWLQIPCAFDIESTSLKEEKAAFMYMWSFAIGATPFIGRTWDEFKILLEKLKEYYHLNDKKQMIIYVHNLSFEFQFFRKLFQWEKVFSTEKRKVLFAKIPPFVFKCSYFLSGMSLEKVAENYCVTNTKKVGSLKYHLKRLPSTPLSEKEIEYSISDVLIVTEYIKIISQDEGNIAKLPYTKTGYVRRYCKNMCFYGSAKRNKNKSDWLKYRNFISSLTLEMEEYKNLRQLFTGGFTHANAYKVGKIWENVKMLDIASSYPTVMIAEQFPMSKGVLIGDVTLEELEKYIESYCCMFQAGFTDIEGVLTYEHYLSKSKCFVSDDCQADNGRIVSASKCIAVLSDVDWKIVKQVYKFENVKIKNLYIYKKGYLPKPLILSILDFYESKTKLKGIKGKELEYLIAKGCLNSIYGMMVTDVLQDTDQYDNILEWNTPERTEEERKILDFEALDKYNKSKTRFLFYPWGVWVTKYAARNLWIAILKIKDDYIYSDTDSIKMINFDKHADFFNKYNQMIEFKLKECLKFYKIDENRITPKDIKGNTHLLGVWDNEGTAKYFKTLGAKRYLYYTNSLNITVAGLPKRAGVRYLIKRGHGDIIKSFEAFKNDMYLSEYTSGKKLLIYQDKPVEVWVKDYKGNIEKIKSESSVCITRNTFNMNMSEEFGKYLFSLLNNMNEYIKG